MKVTNLFLLSSVLAASMLIFAFCKNSSSKNKNQMVRLAKLEIDSTQVENYNVLLKEEIETLFVWNPGY